MQFGEVMQSETNDDADTDRNPGAYVFSVATRTVIDAFQGSLKLPSLETNLEKVSERIGELNREIQALKSCQNAATAACSLPNELLLAIFLLLSEDEDEHGAPTITYSWIRATHVCRHWRMTAINCPALWTKLDFTKASPMLVELLLERSGGAALSVTYSSERGHSCAYPKSLVKVLSHMDRVRSLILEEPSGPYRASKSVKELLDHCSGSLHALETLDLAPAEPIDLSTPPDFLRQKTPKISTVSLLNCDISWGIVPYGPRMTSLTLLQSAASSDRPSSTELFDKLAQMPLLRILDLAFILPRYKAALSTTRDPPFVFSSLHFLGLCDSEDQVADFFRSARSHTVTHIDLALKEAATGYPSRLVDEMLSFSRPRRSTGKPHLDYLHVAEGTLHMSSHWVVGNPALDHLPSTFPLYLNFTGLPIDPGPPLLHALIQHFHLQCLSHLSTLCVGPRGRMWDLESYRFFARLPNLERISLQNASFKGLFDVLQEEVDTSQESSQGQMPFPRLSRLSLSGRFFQVAVPNETRKDFLKSFILIAKRRHRASCPISELRIRTDIQARHIEYLRRSCPGVDVVWGES